MLSVLSTGLECWLEQELGCKERMEERPCGGSKEMATIHPQSWSGLFVSLRHPGVCYLDTDLRDDPKWMSPFHMWHPLCFTSYFFPPHTVFLPLHSFLFPPNPSSSFCTPHPQPPSELTSFKFLPLSGRFYDLLIQHEPLQSSIPCLVDRGLAGVTFSSQVQACFPFIHVKFLKPISYISNCKGWFLPWVLLSFTSKTQSLSASLTLTLLCHGKSSTKSSNTPPPLLTLGYLAKSSSIWFWRASGLAPLQP